MIDIIILGLVVVIILYGYILYNHPLQKKDKDDWPGTDNGGWLHWLEGESGER